MAGRLEAALAKGGNSNLRGWVILLQGRIVVVLGRVLVSHWDHIKECGV